MTNKLVLALVLSVFAPLAAWVAVADVGPLPQSHPIEVGR